MSEFGGARRPGVRVVKPQAVAEVGFMLMLARSSEGPRGWRSWRNRGGAGLPASTANRSKKPGSSHAARLILRLDKPPARAHELPSTPRCGRSRAEGLAELLDGPVGGVALGDVVVAGMVQRGAW